MGLKEKKFGEPFFSKAHGTARAWHACACVGLNKKKKLGMAQHNTPTNLVGHAVPAVLMGFGLPTWLLLYAI